MYPGVFSCNISGRRSEGILNILPGKGIADVPRRRRRASTVPYHFSRNPHRTLTEYFFHGPLLLIKMQVKIQQGASISYVAPPLKHSSFTSFHPIFPHQNYTIAVPRFVPQHESESVNDDMAALCVSRFHSSKEGNKAIFLLGRERCPPLSFCPPRRFYVFMIQYPLNVEFRGE